MKQYTKQIDGKTVIKAQNEIVLRKGGKMVINPSEEMLLADGWVVYEAPARPEKSESQKARIALINARYAMRNKIIDYDKSSNVNSFKIGEMQLWLDKSTRSGLMLRFQAEQSVGKAETTLWCGSTMYTLPITDALNMLMALELYASECYDVTQSHIAAINKLQTLEEIEQYDFRVGYPEKLSF